jgi:leucyl-tRNA synthetase
MPISAAAKKLKFELDTYGNPPNLPVPNNKDQKYQYEILQQLGLTEQQIPDFIDANHWVKFFPPRGREHIKKFGVHVDHSRSFITTELNPYYDSFIRWQFTLLKEKGYIKYGQRASIYSPKDKQMCADHDRAEGEGVVPD